MKKYTVYTTRTEEIEETWIVDVPNGYTPDEAALLQRIKAGNKVTLWSEDHSTSDIEVTSYEEGTE